MSGLDRCFGKHGRYDCKGLGIFVAPSSPALMMLAGSWGIVKNLSCKEK